jgi:cephalosporin-C deacetylase-like acetyl esterase
MCAQFDLEVSPKRSKNERPYDFHEFWSKEVRSKKHPEKNLDV